MKILHYFFLVLVSIILVFGILFSLLLASFCFNPQFFDIIQSGNIELSSHNFWLISCFILAITFIEGLILVFKNFINWLESQFNKLKG